MLGVEVRCTVTITQESRQRAKILVDATMEHFSSCSAPMLESFLLSHRKDIQVKRRFPKKCKLHAAIDGEKNMIHLAFDLRTNENHIEKEYENLKKTREKIVRLK